MMFRKEDIALRRAVSGALEELLNQGYITTLIDKYAKDEVLEVAPPYKL
jgi:ABC-type amino acid transport substrate-binding protein